VAWECCDYDSCRLAIHWSLSTARSRPSPPNKKQRSQQPCGRHKDESSTAVQSCHRFAVHVKNPSSLLQRSQSTLLEHKVVVYYALSLVPDPRVTRLISECDTKDLSPLRVAARQPLGHIVHASHVDTTIQQQRHSSSSGGGSTLCCRFVLCIIRSALHMHVLELFATGRMGPPLPEQCQQSSITRDWRVTQYWTPRAIVLSKWQIRVVLFGWYIVWTLALYQGH